MDKEQALQTFYSGFGVPAYEENTVPDDAVLPYITYQVMTDGFNVQNVLTASIWDRSNSWKSVTDILHRIEGAVAKGGKTVPYDTGVLWVKPAQPFAQNMDVPDDDSIRRKVINIEVEYNSEV